MSGRGRVQLAAMPLSLLYAGAGVLVGAMVGPDRRRRGSLMTPILMLVFGQSPRLLSDRYCIFRDTKIAATVSIRLQPTRGLADRWPAGLRQHSGHVRGHPVVLADNGARRKP